MTSTLPAFNIIRSETVPEVDVSDSRPEGSSEEVSGGGGGGGGGGGQDMTSSSSTLKPDSTAPSTNSLLGMCIHS